MNGKSGWSKSEWIPFLIFEAIMFGGLWYSTDVGSPKKAYYSNRDNNPVITITHNYSRKIKEYYYSRQFDKYIDPKYGEVLEPKQVDTLERMLYNYKDKNGFLKNMHLERK